MALFSIGVTRPLADPDTWWHLWSGEWMLKHQTVLRQDLLSFTSRGEPYLPHSWLAEVLLALPVAAWDLRGLLVFRAVLLVATYGVLAYAVVRRCSASSSQLGCWALVVLAAFAGAASWSVRPYLFSYVLLSGLLILVTRNDARRWLVVPLMLFWANVHGVWLFGLAVVGLRALVSSVDQRRPDAQWIGITILSAVATLLNPFTWHLHTQLLELTTTMKDIQVLEWRATGFDEPTHWAWLALALVVATLLIRQRRSVTLFDELLALAALALGLVAVRNLPISAILLAWVAAPYVPRLRPDAFASPRPSALSTAVLVVAITVLATLAVTRFPSSGEPSVLAGDNLPVDLVEDLAEGRVFTVDGWGGIVSYQKWPNVLVAYDTRIDFHGKDGFENYWQILLSESNGSGWLSDHCVSQVLALETWPLVDELETDPRWQKVSSQRLGDGRTAVLLRNELVCEPENSM